MKAEVKGKQLIITIDLQDPQPSSSGKMMIVASTGGFQNSGANYEGRPISISINAGYKN